MLNQYLSLVSLFGHSQVANPLASVIQLYRPLRYLSNEFQRTIRCTIQYMTYSNNPYIIHNITDTISELMNVSDSMHVGQWSGCNESTFRNEQWNKSMALYNTKKHTKNVYYYLDFLRTRCKNTCQKVFTSASCCCVIDWINSTIIERTVPDYIHTRQKSSK